MRLCMFVIKNGTHLSHNNGPCGPRIVVCDLLVAGMATARVTNSLAWSSPGQQAAALNSLEASPRGLGGTGGKPVGGSTEALRAPPFAEMQAS